MVVEASYYIGTAEIATTEVTGYTITPTVLTDGVTEVVVTYSEGGVTCSASQPVTVKHGLTGIRITTMPAKVEYEYQDTLVIDGIVVTADYSDGTSAEAVGYTYSPTSLNTVGTQAIEVSYTEDGITRATSFDVIVNRKSIAEPTWKSNLTYNGQPQSVTGTDYWNNYNTTYMTIGGTISATGAGSNYATFTLTSNYRWSDGSTEPLDVEWTINKAAGSLSVSPTTLAVTASELSQSATITKSGNGTISYSPTSITGLTISQTGNTLTITGDGSTTVTATSITISVEEDDNYTAPTPVVLTVSATYWEWGDETAAGDEAWWAGLKTWAAKATASERAECVGKTKKMNLSTAVLGANAVTMLCIGADQDGTGTLAFQTQGTLPMVLAFSSSNAVWIGSAARTQCDAFYQACDAKNSIKIVSKGTCPNQVSSKNGTATYNDETVFLLSETEAGLDNVSSLTFSNSTTSNSECTKGYNAAYSYYTSAATRIKYAMDANGNVGTTAKWWWERSRRYNTSGTVCGVSTTGSATGGGYNTATGSLAPAFVIG